MADLQVNNDPTGLTERLARHRLWEQLMQAEVTRALNEHRRLGHTIVIRRNGKIVSLQPHQY
jgi:hypothetical protein